MKKLDKAYKGELSTRQGNLDRFVEFNNRLTEFEQLFESLAVLKKASIGFSGEVISLSIKVKTMDEIAPVLELIDDVVGYEFDYTSDYASDWYTMRTFKRKADGWITVYASADNDAKGCRSVIDGYDTVPRYKIECDGEAA